MSEEETIKTLNQLILDRSAINKQIMREIHFLCERLDEAGESDFVGCDGEWEYSFKRTKLKDAT